MFRLLQVWWMRRQLTGVQDFIRDLEDQEYSAQYALRLWRDKRMRLEEQIAAIEPADAIVRRLA